MALFSFKNTVLRNLFSKPATTKYPAGPVEFKERTRGHIEIDIDACIFCGLCARKCPTGAITVSKENKDWGIERFNCIQCNSCVEVCPKKCLTMKNEYTSPEREKTKEVFKNA